jgi:hypothetical protein
MPIDEKVEHVHSQLLEAEKANTCGEESRHNYFDMTMFGLRTFLGYARAMFPLRQLACWI